MILNSSITRMISFKYKLSQNELVIYRILQRCPIHSVVRTFKVKVVRFGEVTVPSFGNLTLLVPRDSEESGRRTPGGVTPLFRPGSDTESRLNKDNSSVYRSRETYPFELFLQSSCLCPYVDCKSREFGQDYFLFYL